MHLDRFYRFYSTYQFSTYFHTFIPSKTLPPLPPPGLEEAQILQRLVATVPQGRALLEAQTKVAWEKATPLQWSNMVEWSGRVKWSNGFIKCIFYDICTIIWINLVIFGIYLYVRC